MRKLAKRLPILRTIVRGKVSTCWSRSLYFAAGVYSLAFIRSYAIQQLLSFLQQPLSFYRYHAGIFTDDAPAQVGQFGQ